MAGVWARRFDGQTVLVVGGAGAIGGAVAGRLAAEGARVAIADLDAEGAAATAAELGGFATEIDVTDEGSVGGAIARVVEGFGALDSVVSTAGYLSASTLEQTTLTDWQRTFAVNATGAFLLVKHCAPILRERGGGSLLLFSSTSGLSGAAGEGAYAAAKAAVIGLTRVAAAELAPYGIRVNCLCPGWVDTPFNDPVWDFLGSFEEAEAGELAAIPLGRQGRPEEIASVAAFLLSSDASYITGVAYEIDGGSHATG